MDRNEKMINNISFGYFIYAVLILIVYIYIYFADLLPNNEIWIIVSAILIPAFEVVIGVLFRKLSLSKKDLILGVLIILSTIYSLNCINSTTLFYKIIFILGSILNIVSIFMLYKIEKDNNVI